MKEEIMSRLNAVLTALNAISVSGKQNLVNLSGSIAVLEEIAGVLNTAEIQTAENNKAEE